MTLNEFYRSKLPKENLTIGYNYNPGQIKNSTDADRVLPKTESSATRVSFFDGDLFQLVGWKILGFFVTFFTLGICSPWSFCMVYKWETTHTIIDGKRLGFDGSAIQLFGHWIKWLLATVVTLGIYSFWVNIKLKQWRVKHTFFVN